MGMRYLVSGSQMKEVDSYTIQSIGIPSLVLMEQAAAQRGKHAAVSLNWPQAVLQVSFRDAEPARELVVEEANEGERCG